MAQPYGGFDPLSAIEQKWRTMAVRAASATSHIMGDVNDTLPPCPECASGYTYEMGALLVCPECGHEWSAEAGDAKATGPRVIKDAVGNILADGDTVTVVKDLKIKGSSRVIKVGTKVRGVRLMDGLGDHDIDCKVDGVGPMQLKSSVVKKV
jgi:protein PhnA